MAIFDIFASNASSPIAGKPYAELQLLHAGACRSDDATLQELGKKRLGALTDQGTRLGHLAFMKRLKLSDVDDTAIAKLPEGSVLLRMQFRLAKRYVSRDDSLFFPSDNPLRREHVFKVPTVAAATWKGSLRAACVEHLVFGQESAQLEGRLSMLDLFGDEKSVDDDADLDEAKKLHKLEYFLDQQLSSKEAFHKARAARADQVELRPDELHQRGRLHFFPSWFAKTRLDVLNPRDKKKRTGTQPITIEVVPAGAASSFTLLYVPFDLFGKEPGEVAAAQQRDWKMIGAALLHMFSVSGFGAKKSSGCGRIRQEIKDFKLQCRSTPFTSPSPAITDVEKLTELGNAFAETRP